MKNKSVMWLVCGLAMSTGCAGARMEERLPPVQKLECWKDRFRGWSKGVVFPVTVVVTTQGEGAFRAYGVDPDRRRILFLAEGDAQEHLREIPGDPLWGTVVVLDVKALGLAEVLTQDAHHDDSGLARVHVAVDLVRDAHLAPRVTRR